MIGYIGSLNISEDFYELKPVLVVKSTRTGDILIVY